MPKCCETCCFRQLRKARMESNHHSWNRGPQFPNLLASVLCTCTHATACSSNTYTRLVRNPICKVKDIFEEKNLYNVMFANFLRNPFSCFFHNCIVDWVSSLTLCFGYANSMLNPIIYGVLHRDFRKTFIEILSCHMIREYFRAYNSKY